MYKENKEYILFFHVKDSYYGGECFHMKPWHILTWLETPTLIFCIWFKRTTSNSRIDAEKGKQ